MKTAFFKTHLVGFVDDRACDSKTTRQQIEEAKKYELDIYGPDGKKVTWDDIDNPNEPRTILRAIESDRELRIDQHNLMADRPLFAVFTISKNRIVRLEFYEGHDALEKVYDLRSKELQGKELQDYLESDPQAYDPVAFLEETFGIPKEFSKPILDKIHKKNGKD